MIEAVVFDSGGVLLDSGRCGSWQVVAGLGAAVAVPIKLFEELLVVAQRALPLILRRCRSHRYTPALLGGMRIW